jgi:hypothetical protein
MRRRMEYAVASIPLAAHPGAKNLVGRYLQQGMRGGNLPTAGKAHMIQISRKRCGQSTVFRDKQI